MRYGRLTRLRLSSFGFVGSSTSRHHVRSQHLVAGLTVPRYQQRHSSTTGNETSSSDLSPRRWSTPLAKTIADAIEVTGPISIASYMRQCLTSPDGGYYTSTRSDDPSTDPFGAKGDFITSPEISQIFGELVGVWFMTEWMAQGRPKSGVQLIEFGPGRGTLMSDILRTASQFKAFAGAIDEVWLVEAGPALREKQRETLCGEETTMVEKEDKSGRWWEATSKFGNTTVKWVEDAILLPESRTATTPFIIAHEFFDAMPIHAFESVAPTPQPEKTQLLDKDGRPMVRQSGASQQPQWRELMVVPAKKKFSITPEGSSSETRTGDEPEPDFRLTHAHASNPMSLILPERPRYRHLKPTPGSRIEVSPESLKFMGDIANRIGSRNGEANNSSGAALIIDYGPDITIPINSLRGIRSHKVISPFVFPGQADLSVDVDFTALADAALEASDNVEVHGPVEQGMWLTQLGIQDRAQRLLKSMAKQPDSSPDSEGKLKEFNMGWRRLVEGGPRGMGKSYKVLAILPEGGGKRRPVGFGGGVVS